jgi:DNA-directed RNA polymerase I subunit RPA43
MGQLWSTLETQEKESYQQKAAQERERVAKELEAWKAAGGVLEQPAFGAGSGDPNALVFPVARIRKICKLDEDVKGISKEGLALITKCAELATAKLGREVVRVAQLQNRRKLLPDDVAQVCQTREQFLFLKDDIKDLVREQLQEQKDAASESDKAGGKRPKAAEVANSAAAAGSKLLTAYFGGK